jgi:hypothetical protein
VPPRYRAETMPNPRRTTLSPMTPRPAFRRSAGAASPLLLLMLLLVAVLLGGGAWWLLRSDPDSREVVGPGGAGAGVEAERNTGAPAAPRTMNGTPLAGGAGAGTPATEPTSAGSGAAPTGPPTPALRRQRVERTLETFYGADPDIHELLRMIADIGRRAVVDEDSFELDEDRGELIGRVRVPDFDLEGHFRLQGGDLQVDLETGDANPEWTERSFSITLRAGEFGVDQGRAYISHAYDEYDLAMLQRIGRDVRVNGWQVTTSLVGGTQATPILARYDETDFEGTGLVMAFAHMPGVEHDYKPIQMPMELDFGPFEIWNGLFAPHRP